jgi:hypothetical protein
MAINSISHGTSAESTVEALSNEVFDSRSLDIQVMAEPVESFNLLSNHQFANFPLDDVTCGQTASAITGERSQPRCRAKLWRRRK